MSTTALQSATRAARLLGPLLGLATLVCCGASSQKSVAEPGATNMQAPENYTISGKRPSSGQCFQRDEACAVNNDCCSLWCVNGYCAIRQP